ncbi:MAG: Holliday junction resolvase RuvX [Flavobacteriales bacterium]|nr:Holliday junction resolvase RuvX [Flavobacteriales bacterium]
MPRILAIDHGAKRTGLAVTDPLQLIASALDTVPTEQAIDYLKAYVAREQVEGFVVGLPVDLQGRATDATPGVLTFIGHLKRACPGQWVETVDERFSSSMAQQALHQSGKGRMARREKGQLDRISATILLQGFLERRTRMR